MTILGAHKDYLIFLGEGEPFVTPRWSVVVVDKRTVAFRVVKLPDGERYLGKPTSLHQNPQEFSTYEEALDVMCAKYKLGAI